MGACLGFRVGSFGLGFRVESSGFSLGPRVWQSLDVVQKVLA